MIILTICEYYRVSKMTILLTNNNPNMGKNDDKHHNQQTCQVIRKLRSIRRVQCTPERYLRTLPGLLCEEQRAAC